MPETVLISGNEAAARGSILAIADEDQAVCTNFENQLLSVSIDNGVVVSLSLRKRGKRRRQFAVGLVEQLCSDGTHGNSREGGV